jgi:hypothetical protein
MINIKERVDEWKYYINMLHNTTTTTTTTTTNNNNNKYINHASVNHMMLCKAIIINYRHTVTDQFR